MGRKLSLALLVIVLVSSPIMLSIDDIEAIVIRCEGVVHYRRDVQSPWEVLAVGDQLRIGMEIRTTEYSSAELVVENIFIQMNPGTYLIIKNIARQEKILRFELEQASGGIWSKVLKTLNNLVCFEVVTPTAVAGVEGTVFRITYGAENTEILVAEGLVKVRDLNDRETTLKANEKAKISREGILRLKINTQDRKDLESMNRWGREKENKFGQSENSQTGQVKTSKKSGKGSGSGSGGGSNSGNGSGKGGPK